MKKLEAGSAQAEETTYVGSLYEILDLPDDQWSISVNDAWIKEKLGINL